MLINFIIVSYFIYYNNYYNKYYLNKNINDYTSILQK